MVGNQQIQEDEYDNLATLELMGVWGMGEGRWGGGRHHPLPFTLSTGHILPTPTPSPLRHAPQLGTQEGMGEGALLYKDGEAEGGF